ncbi:MAG TPA: MaoC family dehydratase [Dehalococcoidia bacterium]|nr:MaoC family dehydratase [Dehalococcoidia bacterium]
MTTRETRFNVGDQLPAFTKTITQDRMDLFESVARLAVQPELGATPPVNIHTDAARARELGLTRPIASGQMSFAYLHELLSRAFGIDFRQGGQLSVTFLKPVYDGDRVTAHGVVQEKESVNGRTRLRLQVWLENQEGIKTCAGEAEVVVPSPLT